MCVSASENAAFLLVPPLDVGGGSSCHAARRSPSKFMKFSEFLVHGPFVNIQHNQVLSFLFLGHLGFPPPTPPKKKKNQAVCRGLQGRRLIPCEEAERRRRWKSSGDEASAAVKSRDVPQKDPLLSFCVTVREGVCVCAWGSSGGEERRTGCVIFR